jgi:hypothetical protein
MKKKNYLLMCVGVLLTIGACRQFDDSALWEEIRQHEARLALLEAWQTTVNRNIGALEGLVTALQANDYVTGVTPFAEPAPGGYTIGFTKSDDVVIYHGSKGADGANGTDGDDGATPHIGVGEFPDGSRVYYWMIDGEWLLNGGEKIPVTGPKGADGDDGDDGAPGRDGDNGAPGKDGITPQLRINPNSNEWEVCTNGTCNSEADWAPTGVKATGNNGAQGATGAQGTPGDAIFAADGVDYTSSPDYVTFTLADGKTVIRLPKFKDVDIVFTPPASFSTGETRAMTFTLSGTITSVKMLDLAEGWKVAVAVNDGKDAGTFTITAPGTWTVANFTDEAFVFVTNTSNATIMKSLMLEGEMYTPAVQALQATETDPCEKTTSFALADTETGVSYRLLHNGEPVGEVLSGTGEAATFAGTFSEPGVYSAQSVAFVQVEQVDMSNPYALAPGFNPGTVGIPGK